MTLWEPLVNSIASHWRVKLLKEVADKPQYGLTATAENEGTIRFLRITDITERGVNWEKVPFCNGNADKIQSCKLKPGDIVFATNWCDNWQELFDN